jgi:hypothetical protein
MVDSGNAVNKKERGELCFKLGIVTTGNRAVLASTAVVSPLANAKIMTLLSTCSQSDYKSKSRFTRAGVQQQSFHLRPRSGWPSLRGSTAKLNIHTQHPSPKRRNANNATNTVAG